MRQDLTHLEEGTVLEICDIESPGHTVKVQANGEFYYVFKQDIGLA